MAVKTVFTCDVCGIEPKDGDTSAWRTVTIGPLEPGAPESYVTAQLCHKPSCLTTFAKDHNTK